MWKYWVSFLSEIMYVNIYSKEIDERYFVDESRI